METLYETALLDTYNRKANVSIAQKNHPEVTNEALPSLYPWALRRGSSYLHKILTL